jgi:hypothetical protein
MGKFASTVEPSAVGLLFYFEKFHSDMLLENNVIVMRRFVFTCQDVSFGGITIMAGVEEMSLSCLLKI